MKKSPHPVDAHVGRRIRQQRTLLGWSQSKLAEAVGLTFQQCQKYENGSNRVSASRMWQFAQALGVPVASFFEGLPEGGRAKKAAAPEVDPGMLTLAKHFKAQKDAGLALIGKAICFAHEPNGPTRRVQAVGWNGMVTLVDMAGEFAPHLFVPAPFTARTEG